MTETIFNIIQSISIIIASSVAIIGINSWRKEAKWKRKFELAEEVLSAFYDIKDRIAIIRNPFSSGLEGNSREKNENESADEKRNYDLAHIPFERYNAQKEGFSKLYSLKYRFMAVFGKEYETPFNEINKIVNEILGSARILGSSIWKKQGRPWESQEMFQQHLDRMWEYEGVIWSKDNESDIILKRINETIEKIEMVCSKIKQ